MKALQWLMVIGVLLALPAALFLLLGDLDRIEESRAAEPAPPGPEIDVDCPFPEGNPFTGPTAVVPNWLALWLPIGVIPVVLGGIGWRERFARRPRRARSFGIAGAVSAIVLGVGTALLSLGSRAPFFLDEAPETWLPIFLGGVPGLLVGLPLLYEVPTSGASPAPRG